MFFGELAAVAAIDLITVIFCRVMGSCHHDARVAMKLPRRKRKRRHRHQLGIEPDLDPVRGEHSRRFAGKQAGFDPAVIRHRNRRVRILSLEHFRKPLGRAAHGIDIHAVGTRADHAAQAGRTEREIAVKAFIDLLIIAFDRLEVGLQVRVLQRVGKPAVV